MAKSTRFSRGSQISRAFMFAAIVGISASVLAQVPLVNPSFEIPALPNGQVLAATAARGWEIRGDVALINKPTAQWNTNIAQQHGRQWAFLRPGTAISQTVSLQPGTYVVSLQAAQAGAATAAQIKVTLGTISAAPLTPAMTSGVMTFGGIAIATAGSYKLTLEIPEPAPGAGLSYGVSLDDVIVSQAGTNAAPSVVIVTPMTGQSIIATTTLLRADARDSDGTISRVEFYDGATLLGTAVAAPWTFSINTNSNLARNITAKAYDNLGASTISDPIYFSHNTGGVFPFVRNGNFESPGLVASSYSDSPDSWISYNGGIATAGAVPPFGSTILTPPEGKQTYFGITANGQSQLSQSLSLPAGNYGLSFRVGMAYQHSLFAALDATSMSYTASGRYRMPVSKASSGNSSLVFYSSSNDYNNNPGMNVVDDVKIGPAGPATISWVSPPDLQSYAAPAAISLAVNADTYDRSITKIEYYADNVLAGTVSGDVSFSSVNWQNVMPGNYTLTAKVTDSTGAVATSSPRSITVAAGAGYPAFYNGGFEQGASAGIDATVVGSGWLGYYYFSYVSNGASAPPSLPAPQGVSVAALYGMTTMSQDVHFPMGTFKINFKAAQFAGNISIRVKVNDVVVGTFTPTASYASYSTNAFTINAVGLKTVRFEGASPGDGNRVGLDDLTITAFTPVGGEPVIPNDPPTPVVTITPSLSFAAQKFGTFSATKNITLTNSGSTVATVALPQNPNATDDYQVTNGCPLQLGVGASCNVSVAFLPNAAGPRTNSVPITVGNVPLPPVQVTGTGSNGLAFKLTPVDSIALLVLGPVCYTTTRDDGSIDSVCEGGGGSDSGGASPCPPGISQCMNRIEIRPGTDDDDDSPGMTWSLTDGLDARLRHRPTAPTTCDKMGENTLGNYGSQLALLPPELRDATLSSLFDRRAGNATTVALLEVPAYTSPDPAADIGANVALTNATLVGDPIHAGIGNKAHRQTDYQGDGGYALSFSRTYNAQAPEVSAYIWQNMGPGWTSVWDKSVNLENGGIVARVTRGDGSSLLFNKANGSWYAAAGITHVLTQLTNGWTLVKNTITENYNAAGRLISITLGDGKTYTLAYETITIGTSTITRLVSVTSPTGKQITFVYTTNTARARLWKMINPAGAATGTTTYTYDSLNRLASVIYPDAYLGAPRTRQYRYENTTYNFALTSIINEAGETYVKFEYGADGRATRSVFAPNAPIAEANVGDTNIGFDDTGGTSTTTDANGTIITRTFALVAGRVLPSLIQYTNYSAACPTCTLSESFGYTATGKLASSVDRNGVATTYQYDNRDLPISVTQAAGTGVMRTVTTTWHPTFRQPITVTEPTRVTNYTYDSAGRTTQVSVTADGTTRTTVNTYDVGGFLTSVKGPRTDVNDTTTYTYFSLDDVCVGCRGQVKSVTNPLSQVATYDSYDVHSKVLSMRNLNGITTTATYDERGRVLTSTQAGQTTTTTYNMKGQTETVTDPYGAKTTFIYDAAQRLTGKDWSNQEKVRYTLDHSGRTTLTLTFDAANIESSRSSTVYDGLNRATQRIDADGRVTNYSYDNNGNVTAVTDPNNLTTTTSYDQLNRPILVTDPLSKTTGTTYTADGKIASVTDPDNNITTYQYTGFGEQKLIQSPDTGTATSTFNAGGLMVTTTDARGKTKTYTYDVLGRMTQVTYNDTTIGTSQTYDIAANGVGQLSSVTDPSGSTSFTYDSNRRVASKTSVIGGLSKTVSYARDSVGRLTGITYPSGNLINMTYAEGRVTNLTLNTSPLISAINYFPMGGAESWLLGANVTGTQAYIRTIDKNSRISQYSTPTGYRALTFDNASRISGIGNYLGTSMTANATQAFTYDNAGRLSTFSGYTSNGNASPNITQTQSFSYDYNGNRLSSTLQGTASTFTYQAGNNRLAGVSGGIVKTNTYDASGNLTNDGANTYNYDARGRMVSAVASGITTSYLINYQNLRVKKANVTEIKHFVYDDAGHMLGEYDGSGNVIAEYFWLGDVMVAVRGVMPCLAGGSCTETATGYVWTDHLDTPREVTRVNATNQHVSLWKWDSLPFGETLPNANPSNFGVMAFNHKFPGQYTDSETGLSQNWNRDYDQKLGRYVTSDPLGLAAGMNTYAYAKDSPTTTKDTTGLTDDVMQCNSPGGSLNANGQSIIYFPHQFLCLPSGACYGYGPSGSVFGSLGAITEDSAYLKSATCKPVRHAPGCTSDQFAACVKDEIDKVKDSPGDYSPAGKNCMEVSNRIIQTCASKCGFL